MYTVLANKLIYGRRTYEKGTTVTNEIPESVLKELVKAKKIEPIQKKKANG